MVRFAAGIGGTRDCCLKFLALRALFLDLSNIPDWVIVDVFPDLHPKFVTATVNVLLRRWLAFSFWTLF
jgi:hypothetical protein